MNLLFRRTRSLGSALALVLAACGDGPLEAPLPVVELLPAGGEGQYGTPGQRLQAPLKVLVRRADTHAPQEGVAVTWSVESGDASFVTAAVGTSDAQGLVSVTVQLGTTLGTVKIRAQARDREGTGATFESFVVDRPELRSLVPVTVRGGDTISIQGAGFSPTAEQNVVLFSGIRGRVVAATGGELRVEVPRCLPSRAVGVTVQLGTLASSSLELQVEDGGGTPLTLTPGLPLDVDDDGGFTCLRLPGGRRYLVVLQSSGTVGAARYPFTLRGLASSQSPVAALAPHRAPPFGPVAPRSDAAGRFEALLRQREAELVRERRRERPAGPVLAPSGVVPTVGERRSFKVFNGKGGFDDVTAVARLVGRQAVIYVDETAPVGGFTDLELTAFAATFDDVIHPTVSGAFGAVSDLDGNERVVILFTPTVNRLTSAGADGFVGGFFYGLDLLDRDGSNRGEVFYALVPDAEGQFGDARSRELVLRITPAILAHELQHMIHFNERVLKRGAEGTEALWLAEGLAQMAEELVARVLFQKGEAAAAEEYRAGNRTRARRYLGDTGAVSIIVATGQGSLAERGAGWLHTLYLWDRGGGDDVLARLTQSTLTGTNNVAAVTGMPWAEVLADWAAALYASGGYPFEYRSVSLRSLLRPPSPYPLAPESVGASDFTVTGSLWSSSARHYIVIPPSSGFVALRLGGEAGGTVPVDAAFRLRVVPLH